MAQRDAPRIAMVSGTDWRTARFAMASYRIVFPNRTVVIDTAYDRRAADQAGAHLFDRAAYARVLRALGRANMILFTHEHADHVGGALTSPCLAALASKMMMTPEQFAGPEMPSWPGGIPKPPLLAYAEVRAIAPGMVLIKARGHTEGSQMVYVRLANGREYLFTGDLASMIDNVRLLRQRSRYVTTFRSRDDRPAVAAQLAALRRASLADPALTLVPGHDAGEIERLVGSGLLERRFRLQTGGSIDPCT